MILVPSESWGYHPIAPSAMTVYCIGLSDSDRTSLKNTESSMKDRLGSGQNSEGATYEQNSGRLAGCIDCGVDRVHAKHHNKKTLSTSLRSPESLHSRLNSARICRDLRGLPGYSGLLSPARQRLERAPCGPEWRHA